MFMFHRLLNVITMMYNESEELTVCHFIRRKKGKQVEEEDDDLDGPTVQAPLYQDDVPRVQLQQPQNIGAQGSSALAAETVRIEQGSASASGQQQRSGKGKSGKGQGKGSRKGARSDVSGARSPTSNAEAVD